MYYTYKRVSAEAARHDFRDSYVIPENATDEQFTTLNELHSKCHYLGKVGDTHYYYVPDGYPLVEQDPEIEAQALTELPSEIKDELLINGDYAREQRLIRGILKQKFHPNAYYDQDFAFLYSCIIELAAVVEALRAKSYTSFSRSADNIDANTLHTLTSLNNLHITLQEKLAQAGLWS